MGSAGVAVERPPRTDRRAFLILALLAAVTVIITLVARHVVFPAFSWNRDEPVYLWQANGLRIGQFAPTDGGAPSFFHPWLSAAQDGRLFSQYTPGWALALLAGQLVASADLTLVLASVLAVLGTYALARELTRDTTLALVAAALMVASPILVIQGSVYLSYMFTLGMGLFFVTALISGTRRPSAWKVLVAGFLLGCIFITRPFDAVLWGVAAYAFVVVEQWRAKRELGLATLLLVIGFLPLGIATLVYNQRVTGSFTTFPITVADPLDQFGFGLRRIMPGFGRDHYGVYQALRSSAKHLFYMPFFLFGAYLGAIAALYALWKIRGQRAALALVFLAAVFPLGYVFFWGTQVSAATTNLSGPIYYVPLYAVASVLIATAILMVWRRRRNRGIVLVLVLAVATLPLGINRILVNKRISDSQIPWKQSADTIKGRALVFVQGSYLMFVSPFSTNGPKLDDRILYAIDRGPANIDFIRSRPGRTVYAQTTSLLPDELLPQAYPRTPRVSLTRLHLAQTTRLVLDARITAPAAGDTIIASLTTDAITAHRTLTTHARAGAVYETRWTVDASSTRDLGTIRVGAGFGRDAASARVRDVQRESIPYRRSGAVLVLLMPPRMELSVKYGKKHEYRVVTRLRHLQVTPTLEAPPR
ncbi:MAG TPA: glycosyltransferase family 39 protein [Acidimicrobiia bacterium]